jgi:hypothetical protein
VKEIIASKEAYYIDKLVRPFSKAIHSFKSNSIFPECLDTGEASNGK